MITAPDAEGRHESPNSGTQELEHQASSVSIVVPTLNNAATIRKCLESISRIDFPRKNVQVVLVDGGSTDGTRRIAEDFPVEVVDEPKKLRGATYNRGLKTARNEYVAFVDGDGFVSSSWLREGLKIFTADPACAAVYFPSEIPSDVTILQRAIGVYQLKGKLIAVDSQEHAGTGANGAIFRRENIEYVGGFDESLTYGQERELDSRLREHGYRIETGGRNLVYHYPRSSLIGFFSQSVEGGIGYWKRFVISRKRRMIAYMTLRSLVGLLPVLIASLFIVSMLLFQITLLAIAILSLCYLIYVYRNTEGRDGSLLPVLPLLYVSCLASGIGYGIGLADSIAGYKITPFSLHTTHHA